MSLPTLAKIYKNGNIVAVAHCNAGWWIESAGLYRCIKDALFTISEFFKDENSQAHKDYSEKYGKYFGTVDDIKPFDYIEIYEFKFPFVLAMRVFFNKINVKEFEKICIETGITSGK